MYPLYRSGYGLLWVYAVLLGRGLVMGANHGRATSPLMEEAEVATVEPTLFSEQWVEEYTGDDLGCAMGRGSYTWRGSGFGSNINREKSLSKLLANLFRKWR